MPGAGRQQLLVPGPKTRKLLICSGQGPAAACLGAAPSRRGAAGSVPFPSPLFQRNPCAHLLQTNPCFSKAFGAPQQSASSTTTDTPLSEAVPMSQTPSTEK